MLSQPFEGREGSSLWILLWFIGEDVSTLVPEWMYYNSEIQ